jgi:hypothetical protein
MKIHYTRTSLMEKSVKKDNDLRWWIENRIGQSGIESQIRKLGELTSLMAEDYLKEHPERLDDVVTAIDDDGYGHVLVPEPPE